MIVKRILVANRGEIARRIIKTINRLGHTSIALKLESDHRPYYVEEASEVISFSSDSPQETFLNEDLIVNLAIQNKIDLIHPGYGFLSESATFAKSIEDSGILFIGPSSESLKTLGDKISAKNLAKANGIPIIDGFTLQSGDIDKEQLRQQIKIIGFPLIIKAGAGGGGRGMRIATDLDSLLDLIPSARLEAERSFGNDELFIERFLEKVRHIEVQILGDKNGNLIHLYERDCSLQRKFQKVIEIAPAIDLNQETKNHLYECSLKLARAGKLTNAATFEFLVDQTSNSYYFIESNPRLQVEHTTTEEITGLDIVELQINSALGLAVPKQEEVSTKGTAIQVRLCAEVPEDNFTPSAGRIDNWNIFSIQDKDHLRFDIGYNVNESVGSKFDSLIAKIIIHADNYNLCLRDLEEVLNKSVPIGIQTNSAFLIALIKHLPPIGQIHTKWIEDSFLSKYKDYHSSLITSLRNSTHSRYKTFLNKKIKDSNNLFSKALLRPEEFNIPPLRLTLDGVSTNAETLNDTYQGIPFTITARESQTESCISTSDDSINITAPLPGTVINIMHSVGDYVMAGAHLLSIESMKTEHKLSAIINCRIESIDVKKGSQVKKGEVLIRCT